MISYYIKRYNIYSRQKNKILGFTGLCSEYTQLNQTFSRLHQKDVRQKINRKQCFNKNLTIRTF